MCELTQPVPGLTVSFQDLQSIWVFGALLAIPWVIQYVRISIATEGRNVTMSAARARELALVAGVCFLVAILYLACIAFPSDSLRTAWLAQQQAALSPDCIAQVVDPANNAALAVDRALLLLFVVLPYAAGVILLYVARRGRGVYRTWWIRGM